MSDLVSVIVPVYNRGTMVEATLLNLLSTSHRPIELVLVDDGSTDDSLKVLQQFKAEHESEEFSVKIVSQENKGGSAARNTGLRNSTGSYVQFLDSDDSIHRSKFTRQIAQMQEQNSDASVCDFQQAYPDHTIDHSNKNPLWIVAHLKSVGCASPLLSADLAKSFCWTESLPFSQDGDYNLKVLLGAKSVSHLPDILYYQNRHDGPGITNNQRRTNPFPFNQRLSSLMFDGILNFKYGFSLTRIVLGSYSFILLLLKKIKYTFSRSRRN